MSNDKITEFTPRRRTTDQMLDANIEARARNTHKVFIDWETGFFHREGCAEYQDPWCSLNGGSPMDARLLGANACPECEPINHAQVVPLR